MELEELRQRIRQWKHGAEAAPLVAPPDAPSAEEVYAADVAEEVDIIDQPVAVDPAAYAAPEEVPMSPMEASSQPAAPATPIPVAASPVPEVMGQSTDEMYAPEPIPQAVPSQQKTMMGMPLPQTPSMEPNVHVQPTGAPAQPAELSEEIDMAHYMDEFGPPDGESTAEITVPEGQDGPEGHGQQ